MFGGTAGLETPPSFIRALVQPVMMIQLCTVCNTYHQLWNFNSDLKSFSGHISEWNRMLRVFVWVTWQQVRVKLCDARGWWNLSQHTQSIDFEKNKTELCSDALFINKTLRTNWMLSANAKFSPHSCPYFPHFLKNHLDETFGCRDITTVLKSKRRPKTPCLLSPD